MKLNKVIKLLVVGGESLNTSVLGSTLGPLGINISKLSQEIVEKSIKYKGLRCKYLLHIDRVTKKYEIEEIGPISSAIIKEILEEKSKKFKRNVKITDISFEELKKNIIKYKGDLKDLKTILGTVNSMGLTLDGEKPQKYQKEL